MQIMVNGRVVDYMGGEANLEDLLVKLSKTSLPKDHLISSVNVNGKLYTELYPGQSREIPISKISDLQLTTVSLREFAEASVKDAPSIINRIAEHCRATAESFRLYDEVEANQKYADLLEALRMLVHFIDNVRNVLNWNFTSMNYQGDPVSVRWDRFMQLVNELKTAQEDGDWLMLADLIEYEIIPLLEDWSGIFTAYTSNT